MKQVILTRHTQHPKKGHIYAVYDACIHLDTEVPFHVKLGRTAQDDPVTYCVRQFARCMGKMTFIALLKVDDNCLAEKLLFRILSRYRVNTGHEVFLVPDNNTVQFAFNDLQEVLKILRVNSEMLPTPQTVVLEPTPPKESTRAAPTVHQPVTLTQQPAPKEGPGTVQSSTPAYTCSSCGYASDVKQNITRHQRRKNSTCEIEVIQTKTDAFTCRKEGCNDTFGHLSGRLRHERKCAF